MIDDEKIESFVRDRALLDGDELSRAVAVSERQQRPLFDVLIERGFVEEEPLIELASDLLNVERVDPSAIAPDPEALELLPRSAAVENWVLPLQREEIDGGERLVLAMRDPIDMKAMETVADHVDIDIRPVLAGPKALRDSIATAYETEADDLDELSFEYTTNSSDAPEEISEPREFNSKLPPTFDSEEAVSDSEEHSDDEEIHRAETADGNVEGLARITEPGGEDSDATEPLTRGGEITTEDFISRLARANRGLSERALERLEDQDLEVLLSAGLIALVENGSLTVDELVEVLPDAD